MTKVIIAMLSPPGLAYNVITVGGFEDKGTSDWSDDTMWGNLVRAQVRPGGIPYQNTMIEKNQKFQP